MAMSDAPPVDTLTWLSQALSGVNSLRGVELDIRHGLLHQFHAMCMVLLWILSYSAKILLALLPSLVPVPVLTVSLKKLSTLAESYDSPGTTEGAEKQIADSSTSPVARALTQV